MNLVFSHKLITRNFLIKITQRSFRAPKIENYFGQILPDERNRKKNNMYCPKQTLVFEDGKLKLINTTQSDFMKDVTLQYQFFAVAGITLAISSGGLIYSGYFITSILSTVTSIFFLKSTWNHSKNLQNLVKEFNLLENGKEVEIVTYKKKFDVNIKFLSKPTKMELQTIKSFNPVVADLLTPIIVQKGSNKGFYYIAPDVTFENKEELISAIMNNSYVDVFNKVTSKKLMNKFE